MKKAEAMQRLSECCRLQRKSRWTIKAYSEWLDRYITFLAGCHAETIEERMGQFLTRIVTQDKVSAAILHLLPKLDNVASPLDCRKAA